MKNNYLILFLTILMSQWLNAQKKVIAFTKFDNVGNVSTSQAKAIEGKVIEAFSKTNRFVIVDRTNFDKLKEEKELQKSEMFLDGKTVSQTELQGAEDIVTGIINGVSYSKSIDDKGNVSYSAKISLNLKIIDVASGQIVANEMIKSSQSFFGSVLSNAFGSTNTKEKAFIKALNGMQRSIDKFVAKYFPVTTSIIEISDATSSGKAKKVLIDFGEKKGAKKGLIFIVKEIKTVKKGGKEYVRRKEIGKIKILNVEGDDLSTAKVIKGGSEIFKNFNNNADIKCYSKN